MSAEYTLMGRRKAESRGGSSAAHALAIAAVEAAVADDFLLREIEARTEELLESRQRIERAKRELANARFAVIQGAWADGTLVGKPDLGVAVAALLAGAVA